MTSKPSDRLASAWMKPTISDPISHFSLDRHSKPRYNTRMKDFSNDATMAQLQGISVQLGDIFARIYRTPGADTQIEGSPTYLSLQVLEAYKEVRRCLPREAGEGSRHVGRAAAHSATQGDQLPRHLTNQG